MSTPAPSFVREYMCFYLDGREDRVLKNDIDVEKLAEKVMDGAPINEIIMAAVRQAAAPLEHDRKKRNWLEEFASEITEAGGNGDEAYRHYVAGKVDELAYVLESDVIAEMNELAGEEVEPDDADS